MAETNRVVLARIEVRLEHLEELLENHLSHHWTFAIAMGAVALASILAVVGRAILGG